MSKNQFDSFARLPGVREAFNALGLNPLLPEDVASLNRAERDGIVGKIIPEGCGPAGDGIIRALFEEVCSQAAHFLETQEAIKALETEGGLDELTKLPMRRDMWDVLKRREAVAQCDRTQSYSAAVVDLDGFKEINDNMGHPFGDQVIVRVAETLTATTRDTDTVFRYGDDEFVVVITHGADEPFDEGAFKNRIRKALAEIPCGSEGEANFLSASIGIVHRGEVPDPKGLIALADKRMYADKGDGNDPNSPKNRRLRDLRARGVVSSGVAPR